jgi:hypothetical protein
LNGRHVPRPAGAEARRGRRKAAMLHAPAAARPLQLIAPEASGGSDRAMRKSNKKLVLTRETIRLVTSDELAQAVGGWIRPPISWSCPQPSLSGCCPKTE